ncbi:50S ribosomal protein L29 [Streptomyces sp. SID161]|uniref:50S ribosomal protein L29 n=1 Tax=Streptomyces sp. SID161 TaxID=2690251 RepID=UPI00136DBFBB|nr:50S ribosomal protein L29 [Streptomyces sp. SID161]MYW48130.1 50S ribosomal protein L29 [Streptomyces sp. SID161]
MAEEDGAGEHRDTDAKASELRELGNEELLNKLREAKEELFNLRFQAATGQLENHGRLKAVRKDIARIYTLMRERELGIETVESA